jgi:glycosyltransferase involved in cell wall biosynthesis
MFPELIDIIGEIKDVRFLIAGTKSGLFEEVKKRSKNYNNINFLGTVPSAQVVSKTLKSNAIICMFDPNRIGHKIGLPNKVFEAMVTGRPIIVTKNMYYSNNFVIKENFGLAISNTRKDVQKAIITLRDNNDLCEELGKNALKAAIEKYNWDKEKKKLITVYRGFL